MGRPNDRCGLEGFPNADPTRADFSNESLNQVDAMLIAADLSINRSLTDLNLMGNNLGPRGAAAVAHTLAGNMALVRLNLSQNDISAHGSDFSGVLELARALFTNFTLVRADLRGNYLKSDSVDANAARAKLNTAKENRERRRLKNLELLL